MNNYEKTFSEIEDPIKILKRNKVLVSIMKKENERLKKEIEILMINNKTLTELVEVLEEKLLRLTKDIKVKYSYDYERGGWVEEGPLDEEKMELYKKDLNIRRINLQLDEIIRLMKMHKVKHLREGQEINNKASGVEEVEGNKEEEEK